MDKSDVESEYVEEFGNLSMQYFDSYVNKGFITIYTFFQDDRVHEIGPKILTKVTQRIPEVKKKLKDKSQRQEQLKIRVFAVMDVTCISRLLGDLIVLDSWQTLNYGRF